MRVLLANDGFGDAGGVQSYLDRIVAGLAARGHAVAILHRDAKPAPFAAAATYGFEQFSVAGDVDAAFEQVRRWAPDMCFSHNMDRLDVEHRLVNDYPVVKFMHGYLGTCIGGQKRFGFPVLQPCDRAFGAACLALYGPRHCGELNAAKFVAHYRWARAQHDVFARYRALVVASEHMKREFIQNGVDAASVHVNPLFPTHDYAPAVGPPLERLSVAFLGRMTVLKGGDLLVRAVADASVRLGRAVSLIAIGDGPQRSRWKALAADLRVDARFPGWLKGNDRWDWIRGATLAAVPSTWPEPFGLVGLEAAALGVPAIAFDVGGIREWLRPGINGFLVPANPPRAEGFARVLVEALSRPIELTAMRSRAVAVAREMSLERHIDRLEEIFAAVRTPNANGERRTTNV
jgi:glycosyltransferase involved in cell wall biosynthesis